MRKPFAGLTLAALALLLSGCENPLRAAIVNETAVIKRSSSTIRPFDACIDRESPIMLRFAKSMRPATLRLTGSMAESLGSIAWSTEENPNDTLTLTPSDRWKCDDTLGTTTASLTVEVTDTEGWGCQTISWTPEILDRIVYVNGKRGNDSPLGGGSPAKPFQTMQYAMRAIQLLYADKAAEIRMAEGFYTALTDNGAIKITSPLAIRGGYSPDDWTQRDPEVYKTELVPPSTIRYYGCIVVDSVGVEIEGLRIEPALKRTSDGIGSSTCVFVSSDSDVTIRDCHLINHIGSSGYISYGIEQVKNSSLILRDSVIDVISEAPASSAISSLGNIVVYNCNISINDLYKAQEHSINGILATESAIIEGSTIIVKGLPKTDLYGIEIAGQDTKKPGHISGCVLQIGDALSLPTIGQTGIFIARTPRDIAANSGFTISGNSIAVNGIAEFTYGINVADASRVRIINNVVNSGKGEYSMGIVLVYAPDALIAYNTILIGSSANREAVKTCGSCVYLMTNTTAEIYANILCGEPRINNLQYSYIGLSCSDNSCRLFIRENVFAGINKFLLGISAAIETSFAPNAEGIDSLNSEYRLATDGQAITPNNGFILDFADLHLRSSDCESPLAPTVQTPSSVSERITGDCCSYAATDIRGVARVKPFSAGAYEYDSLLIMPGMLNPGSDETATLE